MRNKRSFLSFLRVETRVMPYFFQSQIFSALGKRCFVFFKKAGAKIFPAGRKGSGFFVGFYSY